MLTLKRASCLTLSVLATLALGTACSPTTTKTGGQPLTAPAPGDGSGAPGVGTTSPWGTGSSLNPISTLTSPHAASAAPGNPSASDVLTYHNDTYRSGLQSNESTLTPANVNAAQFGKIATFTTDGLIRAQPLWMHGVQVPNLGARDLLFVADEHDSVYAFDTQSLSPTPVWQRSFLGDSVLACTGCRPLNYLDMLGQPNLIPEAGITATPVIDPTAGVMYVVAQTIENSTGPYDGTPYWKLHTLDITTGAEMPGSPLVITATVSGTTGPGTSSTGSMTFDPQTQLSHASLALNNGIVYIGASSFNDQEPAHGWLFAYNTQTGELSYFISTPHSGDGNIWMSGDAPAIDASGNIYVATGNGDALDVDFPLPAGSTQNPDFDDSVLKFSMGTNGIGLADYFVPYDQRDLANRDIDTGSGGVMLLPDNLPGSPSPHLMVAGGKLGTIYVLNRDSMGGRAPAGSTFDPQIPQEIVTNYSNGKITNVTDVYEMGVHSTVAKSGIPGNTSSTGIFSTPSYFNGNVYYWPSHDYLHQIPVTSGLLDWADSQTGSYQISSRGATTSISANGTQDGIVWAIDSNGFSYAWSEQDPVYTTVGITTQGSNQITQVAGSAGLAVGQTVFAAGVPVGTTITAIQIVAANNTTVTLSQAANASSQIDLATGDTVPTPLTFYLKATVPTPTNNLPRVKSIQQVSAYSDPALSVTPDTKTGAPMYDFTYDWASADTGNIDTNCQNGSAVPGVNPGTPGYVTCQSEDVWTYDYTANYDEYQSAGWGNYPLDQAPIPIPYVTHVQTMGDNLIENNVQDSLTGLPYFVSIRYWVSNNFCGSGSQVATPYADGLELCETTTVTPNLALNPTILLAYDVNDLSTPLYRSDMQGTIDQAVTAAKFVPPTVANGMVFVAGDGGVSIYGQRSPASNALTVTNAASNQINQLAPGSLATIWGSNMGSSTAPAPSLPLGTSLGSPPVSVYVNGVASALLYVSPGQINFQIPPSTAVGTADISVIVAGSSPITTQVPIQNQAIGIFTATNPNTAGFLNGVVQYYTTVNGKVTASPAYYTATGTYPNYSMLPISLDPSLGSPYLEVYATGLNASPTATDNTAAPTILITDSKGVTTSVTTTYAGQQHTYAGLDQVNVPLPPNLAPGTVTLQFPSGTAQPAVQMEISN